MVKRKVPRRDPIFCRSWEPMEGPYTLEQCRKTHDEMDALDEEKLWEVGQVSTVPYMGIGQPPSGRPGGRIQFYSIFEGEIFISFLQERCEHEIYLLGCKGIGKSCLLRAVACWLYKACKRTERVVCIWNMEAALWDLTTALREALLFTYCRDTNVVSAIQEIRDLVGIKAFINERKKLGESFLFILDEVQCLDERDFLGEKRREHARRRMQVKADLLSVTYLGVRCISALSPDAADAVELKRKVKDNYFELRSGFAEEAYVNYMNRPGLGGVLDSSPTRKHEIYDLAGSHPMSLARLDNYIINYVREFEEKKPDRKRKGSEWRLTFKEETRGPSREDVARRFQLESDWVAVKKRFIHSMMQMKVYNIWPLLEKRMTRETYNSREELTSVDPTYVIEAHKDQPAEFCSPLIHTEALREATQAHG